MTAEWKNQAETLLKAIWTPELDPLFWRAGRRGVDSAWYGHVPFAHWLVRILAPRCIVELGSHNGVSYSAFCEAVQRDGLSTSCFAVDTWLGDDHAGFYGEEVYSNFRGYHDQHFGAFSTLLRRNFDDALQDIADNSIDLLHIDGRHSYEDVRHDFESWRCKMSERGVVLFHDTNVRDNGFGVWRFWAELRQDYPSFEFLHGYGLGVLALGTEYPPLVGALVGLRDPVAIGAIRERFAQLGERGTFDTQVRLLSSLAEKRGHESEALRAQLTQAEAVAHRMHDDVARLTSALRSAEQAAAAASNDAAAGRQALAAVEAKRIETERLLAIESRHHADAVARGNSERTKAVEASAMTETAYRWEMDRRKAAEANLERMLHSTVWRMTRPMRTMASKVPSSLRRNGTKALQSVWRVVTPHLNHLRVSPIVSVPALAAPSVPALPAPPALPPQPKVPVICYISGEPDTPGTIYRTRHYAAACRAAGAQVTILRLDEIEDHMAFADGLTVLVIWRAVHTATLATFMERASLDGARIVFDVDDLMIDPTLATVQVIDGIRSQGFDESAVQQHYARIQSTMLAADYCTSSTLELTGHMRRFAKPSFVLPNGFDAPTLEASRMAARRRQAGLSDGLVRIGYASGSRTHQRDFGAIAPVLPSLLRQFPECRLVLFQATSDVKLIDLHEFPDLEPVASQIEWRDLVPLCRLPEELARFDVNLAPLELGNPFCEAKSELKYFEAALAGVPTIASPVGPYRRVIQNGVNGYLAETHEEWEASITAMLRSPELRRRMAQTALNDVLWTYGPERRTQLMRHVLAEWQGAVAAADAFTLELSDHTAKRRPFLMPAGEVVWSVDQLRPSMVTVVIPLYNYAHTLVETLDSVSAQTLSDLDLIIVDDKSTDDSLQVALRWTSDNAQRFNRIVVIQNIENSGLGPTRNAAFSAAETPYILPLDADNLLRPACCQSLLSGLQSSGVAFAYPVIQEFGGRTGLIGVFPYDPRRLAGGNYIDAMALVSKSAWSAVGGYADMRSGWEDYDFWCALAEIGLGGYAMGGPPLADYRVHGTSMLATVTDTLDGKSQVINTVEQRHPWVKVARPLKLTP